MSHYLLIRIEALQQELEYLRQTVLQQTQVGPRSTQLQGLWRGVDVSEDDFAAARRAVFSHAYEE